MAITCEWKVIVGTVTHSPSETKLTMYGGGNVFACICQDSIDENGQGFHQLFDFICDKDHLERILSNNNHYHEYTDICLNSKYKEIWQIAKVLSKHGITVTIKSNDHFTKPF